MAHTPGIWKYQVDRHGDHKSGVIDAANSPLNEPIAIIPHDDCTASQYKMSKANARLIAAAPELLEALKIMVEQECNYMLINNLGNPEEQHGVIISREAIKKAEGGK